MSAGAIRLSSVVLASPLRRDSPRPRDLRNALYAAQYDWHTLFYDCYRSGRHVVLQGPPFFNLLAPLLQSAPLAALNRRWLGRPRHIGMCKRGEIWLRHDDDTLAIDGPIGRFAVPIQPDGAALFAGRRVIRTLSKDNAPRWIADWIAFYRAEHGADAALIYDNGSAAYDAAMLEAELAPRFPDMVIKVIDWRFPYGPQGGMAGAVDGHETPWDSDFCQTGSLQHSWLRFLTGARAVLNVDIDELVLSPHGESIFAATEASAGGFVKFAGRWISGATAHGVAPATCRHADFTLIDRDETRVCPPKWCVVPARHDPRKASWSVHNLFGSRHNRQIDERFCYRHMTAISNGWKEDRAVTAGADADRFAADAALTAAFARTGLARTGG